MGRLMCRFSYVSGACANRWVESIHCIGEEDCEYSSMNILGASIRRNAEGYTLAQEWHQLFCEEHGRFLCDTGDECPQPRTDDGASAGYRQRTLFDDNGEAW